MLSTSVKCRLSKTYGKSKVDALASKSCFQAATQALQNTGQSFESEAMYVDDNQAMDQKACQ